MYKNELYTYKFVPCSVVSQDNFNMSMQDINRQFIPVKIKVENVFRFK